MTRIEFEILPGSKYEPGQWTKPFIWLGELTKKQEEMIAVSLWLVPPFIILYLGFPREACGWVTAVLFSMVLQKIRFARAVEYGSE